MIAMSLNEPTQEYWNRFYRSSRLIEEPSSFARFVSARYSSPSDLIDIGCGNGRDSFYFESQGWRVTGIDSSAAAIAHCNLTALSLDSDCKFFQRDAGDRELVDLLEARLRCKARVFVYARFFLHSISEKTQAAFLDGLEQLLAPGARVCLEYRTIEDANLLKVEEEHYRRYIHVSDIHAAMLGRRFDLEFIRIGHRMAVYGPEDPHVARMIFRRAG